MDWLDAAVQVFAEMFPVDWFEPEYPPCYPDDEHPKPLGGDAR